MTLCHILPMGKYIHRKVWTPIQGWADRFMSPKVHTMQYLQLMTFWPMGSKHYPTEGRRVCTARETLLSNKSHLDHVLCGYLGQLMNFLADTHRWMNNYAKLRKLFVCFVLRHINLIGHLMPNQVKENNCEKKFKGEVLGINDKLLIISWLFVFLSGVYL